MELLNVFSTYAIIINNNTPCIQFTEHWYQMFIKLIAYDNSHYNLLQISTPLPSHISYLHQFSNISQQKQIHKANHIILQQFVPWTSFISNSQLHSHKYSYVNIHIFLKSVTTNQQFLKHLERKPYNWSIFSVPRLAPLSTITYHQ